MYPHPSASACSFCVSSEDGAKIRINFETNKKKMENLQNRDRIETNKGPPLRARCLTLNLILWKTTAVTTEKKLSNVIKQLHCWSLLHFDIGKEFFPSILQAGPKEVDRIIDNEETVVIALGDAYINR